MVDRVSIGFVAVAVILNATACSSSAHEEANREPTAPVDRPARELGNEADPPGQEPTAPVDRPAREPGNEADPPGQEPTSSLVIDVEGPLGRIDRPYAFDVRPKDTTVAQARTYRLASGELPPGVVLTDNGTLEGTPTTSGHHRAVVYGEGTCGDASCRLEVRLSVSVPNVILLSGFGPFEDVPVNPSWQAVEPLHDTMIAGYDVRVIQVPVSWGDALPAYFDAYSRLNPSMALASGVAMHETGIRVETTAHNYASGTDVANVVWSAGKIDSSGPDAYRTGMPVDLLIGALEQEGYPTVLSDNAGDYLCNFLFYGLMRRLRVENPDRHVVAGFVHVPGPEVVAPADMTEAWKMMIRRLVEYREQLVESAGGSRNASPGAASITPIVHEAPRY